MKKLYCLLVLLVSITSFAQNRIASKVAEYKAFKAVFRSFQVLTVANAPLRGEVDKVVDNATFATINQSVVSEIASKKFQTIEVSIPYAGGQKTVELYNVDPFNEAFHIDTDKAANISFERGAYYRGIVKGDQTSLVTMNFFEGEMNGVISDASVSNLVIGKLDKKNNTSDYIIYSDANMKVPSGFSCDFDDTDYPVGESQDASREIESTKCVTMYFEIDYDLYLANGSNTTTTANWMTSVFSNVQTLFANDGITVALKSFFIWTTDDPYTGSSSSDYLYQFNELRPVFDGDAGQLIGIDPGGLGGVALLSGLCTENNFSYSDVNFSYNTVPTYSWTIMVITHEMGHLLGSRHTHACAWNGNNTSIDGCGTQAGNVEGSCAVGPIPPSGTIMSYCHLISGVGINFNNGFGPQPTNAILGFVNSRTCLSTDCINTCINTVAGVNVSNLTPTSATINWADVGSTTAWQIVVLPINGNFGAYVNSSSGYSVSNLIPNRFYKARIRPICSGSATPTYTEFIFATPADWCSGVTITDTGGPANDHGNMESYVRTLIPTQPNKKITLTFTAFDLEQDYDYLYVYDGQNITAPELGGYTGTTIPGPFVSTAADGSLTIRFESDPLVVESGYVASVGCEDNLGVGEMSADIDFTYYPNPTNGLVSIASKTAITSIMVYNIAGQLLHSKTLNELDTQVDISGYATGTYFFKLKFNDIEANFKILKM